MSDAAAHHDLPHATPLRNRGFIELLAYRILAILS